MIRHRLNRTLTVYRPQPSGDGAGGMTVALVKVGEIRAQVSQPSAEERQLAQQFGAELTHVVHTAFGTDVARGDELDGAIPTAVATRLRVLATVSNSQATYLRVECEAAQAGG